MMIWKMMMIFRMLMILIMMTMTMMITMIITMMVVIVSIVGVMTITRVKGTIADNEASKHARGCTSVQGLKRPSAGLGRPSARAPSLIMDSRDGRGSYFFSRGGAGRRGARPKIYGAYAYIQYII